jgi:hypothetical protein
MDGDAPQQWQCQMIGMYQMMAGGVVERIEAGRDKILAGRWGNGEGDDVMMEGREQEVSPHHAFTKILVSISKIQFLP